MGRRLDLRIAAALLAAAAIALVSLSAARGQDGGGGRVDTGSVVFLHPDGTGPNHWQAARSYWYGPDALANWDRLSEQAVYRGHMADLLAGTSNGGATTHAFGYKVNGLGSFGTDVSAEGDVRFINSLSGFRGSIMREAQYRDRPVGVVNDGTVYEPGTGAFLAEVGNRNDSEGIALQMLDGRTNNGPNQDSRDPDPQVIMGGGERFFLPAQTPTGDERANGYHGPGSRTDGRNLIEEAEEKGYRVIRTRAELRSLRNELNSAQCRREPRLARCAPKVLGLFARNDTFNDVPEEALIDAGLRDPDVPEDDKRSNLLLYGTDPETPNPNNTTDGEALPDDLVGVNGERVTANGEDPPSVGEMTDLALLVLSRAERRAGNPFMLVTETESTDNFGNNDNSVGVLNGAYRADQAIRESIEYQSNRAKDTLVIQAADSDASGLQLQALTREEDGSLPDVGTANYNPTGDAAENVSAPLDGLYGRGTVAFEAEEDQFGQRLPFAVAVAGTADFQGGILARARGGNADRMDTSELSRRFDNIDVYRMAYENLFGRFLEYPEGRRAPARGSGR